MEPPSNRSPHPSDGAGPSAVTLHDLELDPAVLTGPGGDLPTTHDGQAVEPPDRAGLERVGAVPATGWRLVDARGADHTSWVAPSHEDPDQWWLLELDRADGTGAWTSFLGWPERIRAGRGTRSLGVRLDWPLPPLDLTATEVVDLQVRIGRYAGDGTRLGLDWDPEDALFVVGHVVDAATDEPLPFEPWQTFAGFGPDPVVDGEGETWLPVRWTTYDVGRLPPGDYRLRAQLVALPVHTPVVLVRVHADPPERV